MAFTKLPSPLLVLLLAWVVSIPWALLHGPLDPQWVIAGALGAGVIPMIVGWWSLWRNRGSRRAAVIGTLWAAALLLLVEVYHVMKHGGA